MRVLLAKGLFVQVVVLVALGCGGPDLPATDIVARIGETDIPYSDFEQYLMANSVALEAGLGSEVLSSLLDQFLEEVLLRRLAVDLGKVRPDEDSRSAVKALVDGEVPGAFSAERISTYYDHHREEFEVPERVRLRQILVEDRTLAEQAVAELDSGVLFEEVARRLSKGPGADRGGYQGELSRGDLPPAFAEVIFELEAGEASAIVPTDYGFHVFQVMQKLPAQELSLAETRARIEAALRREAAVEVFDRLVRDARTRYNVVLYARNLPFNYDGMYE